MNEVFLLLGSNIDPEKNIQLALEYINRNFKILDVSHTWQTKPVGSQAGDFLNTAVKLLTESDAETLKANCLRNIESKLGRVRQADKFAPRTIDLDIVIFNGEVLDEAIFKLEHLALPFSELVPNLVDKHTNSTLAEISQDMARRTKAKRYKCLLPTFRD
jgi:2-amino-4-hydroxy-6-hydroxymethyldihydropteridine diphosphokinase